MPSVYHPRSKVTRVCRCGKEFRGTARQKHCSATCRDLARRIPCSECGGPTGYYPHSARPENPRCHGCRRAAKPTPPAIETWTCALCGAEASRPRTRGQRPRYCSPGCHDTAAWQRRAADPFVVPPRVRLAIYERDDWTCQLCLTSVDPELHYLDKMAATLDHIVARSTGGSDDPENLQLAHRSCNSSKCDTPLEDWLERRQLTAA